MEKAAQTQYPVHDLIQHRWSPRAFSEEDIDEDTIHSLFEAARWAPSCYNEQPWEFIIATKEDEELYESLFDCLVEGNQSWAKQAPLLGCSIARTTFRHNGKVNNHARHDVGLAMENLVLEALNQGLYVHQMGGFSASQLSETFSLPDNREPVAMFVVGYPGDPEDLPDELAEREKSERERIRQSKFVHRAGRQGEWFD